MEQLKIVSSKREWFSPVLTVRPAKNLLQIWEKLAPARGRDRIRVEGTTAFWSKARCVWTTLATEPGGKIAFQFVLLPLLSFDGNINHKYYLAPLCEGCQRRATWIRVKTDIDKKYWKLKSQKTLFVCTDQILKNWQQCESGWKPHPANLSPINVKRDTGCWQPMRSSVRETRWSSWWWFRRQTDGLFLVTSLEYDALKGGAVTVTVKRCNRIRVKEPLWRLSSSSSQQRH